MHYPDVGYTNGVIAVREKYLLKDKLNRLCEISAEEAFRALLDSGFGGGVETTVNLYEYEKLVVAEEKRIDAFIEEYAPSFAEKAYLLSPRDFHNAKALVKAKFLQSDVSRMLAPQGLINIDKISACIESEKTSVIQEENPVLAEAIKESFALSSEEVSGAKIGEIFEKGLYRYLFTVVKRKPVLKKLLISKIDMTNILTAFRATDKEEVKEKYLPLGSLKNEELNLLFGDEEQIKTLFYKTPYKAFIQSCLKAREKSLPQTEAEKIRDSYDTRYFWERRYNLEKTEPFLYYVYRRLTECKNIRIIFVCRLANISEAEIKKRIRAW